ncbi:hypothetical protein NKR23_g11208 [Pleurostoma richardsiae]|uniref:Yeast cell wall synthesis Kre9/Knh1-like N-terminal domain-containing protein n=1 Tax=Pleurostoma richardsiae TaxID=41990 RepID=A0AA38RAQ2_9PEZI|nr:hypothetical protein NKR23_g11208 [Pleurostoma richardsiae]
MRFLLALAVALAPLAAAIQFTSPAENSTLTKGSTVDLTWTSVDTDPTTFSIYLVNFVNFPPFYTPLALDVDTSLSSYNVRVPCAVDSSYGFQFNAINGTNVYVIYAQTPKFFIEGGPCTDPTPTSSTCPLATATVTVTKTTYATSNGTVTATFSPSTATGTGICGGCGSASGSGSGSVSGNGTISATGTPTPTVVTVSRAPASFSTAWGAVAMGMLAFFGGRI